MRVWFCALRASHFMPKKNKKAQAASKVPTIPTIIKRDGRIVPFDL